MSTIPELIKQALPGTKGQIEDSVRLHKDGYVLGDSVGRTLRKMVERGEVMKDGNTFKLGSTERHETSDPSDSVSKEVSTLLTRQQERLKNEANKPLQPSTLF